MFSKKIERRVFVINDNVDIIILDYFKAHIKLSTRDLAKEYGVMVSQEKPNLFLISNGQSEYFCLVLAKEDLLFAFSSVIFLEKIIIF